MAPALGARTVPSFVSMVSGIHPAIVAPTLDAVLTPLRAVGVQRLIRIAREIAMELDLAHELGITVGRVAEDSVRLERAGTSLERARLPLALPEDSASVASGVRGLGVTLGRILGAKPLALDGSIWTPPGARAPVVMRRRADAELVETLARALSLIARRCASRDERYRDTSQLAADLSRLAAVAERIVNQRRMAPPVVTIAYPKRRVNLPLHELPKVIVAAAASGRAA